MSSGRVLCQMYYLKCSKKMYRLAKTFGTQAKRFNLLRIGLDRMHNLSYLRNWMDNSFVKLRKLKSQVAQCLPHGLEPLFVLRKKIFISAISITLTTGKKTLTCLFRILFYCVYFLYKKNLNKKFTSDVEINIIMKFSRSSPHEFCAHT